MTVEEIDEFIDEFYNDPRLVKKYDILAKYTRVLQYIGPLPIILLVPFVSQEPLNVPGIGQIPNFRGQAEFLGIDFATYVFIVYMVLYFGLLMAMIKARYSYPISEAETYYHHLSEGLNHFLNNDYDQALDSLDRFTVDNMVLSNPLPPVRSNQIERYLKKLRSSPHRGSSFDDTFVEFFSIICNEIMAVENDSELSDILEGIETTSQSSNWRPSVEIIFDIYETLGGQTAVKGILVIGGIAGAIIIGFIYKPVWAIVILSGLSLYLGFAR